VFKIVADPHVGHLAWARLFSGAVEIGGVIYNPRTDEEERVGRIYQIHANRRQHVRRMQAGDVVALAGMKSAVTGDTLCAPEAPILLETFRFPEPVISVAISPAADEERDRLHQCAARLCSEDPTLLLSFDAETGEQILSGMGELHLEVAVDRLRSEYGLVARCSPLQIAYRETVQRKAEATGSYRKQTGGHGHFAVARLRLEPLPRGEGIVFKNNASPIELPDQYARAVEAGAREALVKGVLAGYPLTDLRLTLLGGKYHEIDSDSMDFRIAGSMAVRQAARQAAPVLLEPSMQADINVDEAYLGAVLSDFGRRRGVVSELNLRGKSRNILGEVPLAEARGYATDLRSMTQGRGAFTLEFRRYAVAPERQAEQIVAQRQAEGRVAKR
jgi:elongation factor G